MKSAVYFAALVLGCFGQDFQGYSYPKPSCRLQLPTTVTETATETQVFSTAATVYQTQILTSTLTTPVYITSTVVSQRLITSFSTVVSPVTQYQTQTSTVYITPTPVTLSVTVTATATAACAGIQDSESGQAVNNAYLPPDNSGGAAEVSDDSQQQQQYVDNTYLPPAPEAAGPGNVLNLGTGDTSTAFRRSVSRFTPFDTRRARYVLSLGALPPGF